MMKFVALMLSSSSARALSIVTPPVRRCSVLNLGKTRAPLLFVTRSIPVYGNSNGVKSIPEELESGDADSDSSVLDQQLSRLLLVPAGDLNEGDVAILRTLMLDFGERREAAKAQRLLMRLVDEQSDTFQPTCDDFYQVIQAWGHDDRQEASSNVLSLFYKQEELYRAGLESAMPDDRVLKTVLRLLSSSRERGADRRVWSIFERAGSDYGAATDADMYTSLIRSLARSRERDSADRAEKILKEAVGRHPPGINSEGEPTGMTVDSFNVVLTAWAKSGFEDGPTRAEQLLEYMYEVHKQNGENQLTPNVSSFTSLIDAYAQTNEWSGANRSEQILDRLLEQFLDGEADLEPNVASWTIVISAWNRLARKNRRGAEKRADRLLRRMEDLCQAGQTTVAPDAITYNTVMNAWCASRTREGVENAEGILNEMNERYLDGDDEMRPNVRSLRSIIDALVRLDDTDSMDRAESLLDRYEDQMDEFDEPMEDESAIDIYRSMLFGWSKHGDPRRAEEYLDSMVAMGVKADSFCFDRIIESYSRINAPDSMSRTYALFERMEQCSKTGSMKPNERVYTSFIRALTRAEVPELAKKASLLLNRMDELYQEGNRSIQPTTFTLNAVLRACAVSVSDESADPSEAFKVAVGVFNTLRTGREKPDHVSYGNMLQCSALLPPGEQRDSIITSTFRLCCESGLVNSYVVRDLQEVASEELWRSLLQWPEGEGDVDHLPESWRSGFEQKTDMAASQKRRQQGGRRSTRR